MYIWNINILIYYRIMGIYMNAFIWVKIHVYFYMNSNWLISSEQSLGRRKIILISSQLKFERLLKEIWFQTKLTAYMQ